MTAIVARLAAGPIDPVPVDVINSASQWLYNDDKLLFTISDWSYGVNAAMRNISPYPAHATFTLLALPQAGPGEFAAWWEAADGTMIAKLTPLSWLHGGYQSGGYTGPVSVLYGSTDLPPGSEPALLVIENVGGFPVQVGLPPYALGQDLSVSFSGHGFGVSGLVTDVRYLDPPVPEPSSGWILLIAGVGLCGAPKVVSRIRRRRIQ